MNSALTQPGRLICLLLSLVLGGKSFSAVIATFPSEVVPISSDLFLEHTDFDINNDGVRDAVFLHGTQVGVVRAISGNGVIARTYRPDLVERAIEPIPEGALIGATILDANLHWFRDSRPYADGDFGGTATLGVCVDTGCDGYFFGQTAYMGFELQLPDGTHYGWAKIRVSPRPWFSAGLLGWAWETEPNTPIIAGAIPEPGTVTLLGGSALLIWQRSAPNRKENKSAAANRWGLSCFIAWCRSKVQRVR